MTTIIKNADIYTCSEGCPKANCIIFDKETIQFVGDIGEVALEKYVDAEIHDIGGRCLLPGMIDSHIHPGWVTKSLWHIPLPWTEDVNEVLAFVKQYADAHPKSEYPFLYFEYYPTSMFDEHGPTKELLDTAVSDRPVLCQDFGEHLCWVNSKMLELLGVDKDTPDPGPLETFVRDEDGNPTGWIREMAWYKFADNMFRALNWYPPEELNEETIKGFFDFLEESGITAIADGFIENDDQIEAIYKLDKAGKLNVYYDGMVRFWNYEDLAEKIARLKEYRKQYTTNHIKINTMKLFLDGTNESGNSASLHEHINDSGNYGEIMMETDELTKCFLLCNQEGLDLHIHVVGDRGFRVACDAVEAAQAAARSAGVPWVCMPVLAHCEVVDPADMERPAKLGITINWSCHWSGGYFGEEAMNYYSREKWSRMYQFNPMIDSGALVTFSSDVVTGYELHRAYPFFGMQVAATKIDPEFPLDPDKYPNSMRPPASAKLSLPVLLKGYTINGAKQLHWQEKMGSLEPGKIANMLVTDKNMFDTPLDQIKDLKIDAVIFEGKVIRGSL
ncbi:amidohydrolase family protein [Anaerovorax odorimutans]|uniref:Amidohydrolase family protein n=1 Tax=Anaerovorax odorimutans TaxID=109327 RepID=A0ABT1RMR4_9FIRM|nr:amidohydrolase family protein [Anaerovorax odorimutans]MCQ4636478.1 amidohydrolase family protein [Anaerovorax odorimutans]